MSSSEDEILDDEIQKDLLQRLQEYGNDLLGEENRKVVEKKKKKRKIKRTDEPYVKEADQHHKIKQIQNKLIVGQDRGIKQKAYKSDQIVQTKSSNEGKCKFNIIKEKIPVGKSKSHQIDLDHRKKSEAISWHKQKTHCDTDSEDNSEMESPDNMNSAESDVIDDSDSDEFEGDLSQDTTRTKLDQLKSSLGVTTEEVEALRASRFQQEEQKRKLKEKRIETIGSQLRSERMLLPEVIVYEDTSNRKRKVDIKHHTNLSGNSPLVQQIPTDNDGGFDLKRARYEVRRFGIHGMEGKKKEQGMVDLLVKLGAKPTKNQYMNYKQLQEIKKTDKVEVQKKKEIDRGLGYKTKSQDKRKVRSRNDVGNVDGQIGHYKHGVQRVSNAAIEGVNKSSKKSRKK